MVLVRLTLKVRDYLVNISFIGMITMVHVGANQKQEKFQKVIENILRPIQIVCIRGT